jgi:hypothetical protein
MAVPHYNYYPPSGAVVDTSDGRVSWDGRAWRLNGKPYNMPSTHTLIGKAGGPLAGWTYDWKVRAWMEPSSPKAAPNALTRGPTRPQATKPQAPKPQAPKPQAAAPTIVVAPKKKGGLESLLKHPVAPLIGGGLVVASYLTDEPQPPTLPDRLPEATAKSWMMIFSQNQQRFQRRMDAYNDLGKVLLGVASAQTLMDAMPRLAMAGAVDPTVQAGAVVAHRAAM